MLSELKSGRLVFVLFSFWKFIGASIRVWIEFINPVKGETNSIEVT